MQTAAQVDAYGFSYYSLSQTSTEDYDTVNYTNILSVEALKVFRTSISSFLAASR